MGRDDVLFNLDDTSSVVYYACDVSPKAIAKVFEHPKFSDKYASAFVCDLSVEGALAEAISTGDRPQMSCLLDEQSVEFDLATLIFVLSALHPTNMPVCLKNVVR